MPVRTVIERGPKGKRSVAFGIDWPGWSRGAKSSEIASETLESYRERYRPVAGLAGMAREFDAAGPLKIVEDKVGTGSTESEDFANKVGLRIPEGAALPPDGLRRHRETYVAAMRAYNAGEVERRMRSWTLPFLIRHSAFHTLDHAWEMEDKDLSAQDGA